MADRSRTSQRQQMAPGTLAVFKAADHRFGAPASLWGWFSRFGARGSRVSTWVSKPAGLIRYNSLTQHSCTFLRESTKAATGHGLRLSLRNS